MAQVDAQLLVGGDGPMRGAWEKLAAGLGISERVRFLGDVSQSDLPGLYASADIFILPSNARAEAYGLVLLEAMASGLPCIATEVGTGTSFIVQDGVSGLVAAACNPQALTQAINHLLSDPDLRKRMGAAGRERAWQEFTVEKMLKRIETIYTTVLSERL